MARVFEWGRDVVVDPSGSFPVRQYAKRRADLSELLLDAERWDARDYLVHGSRRVTYAEHAQMVERLAASLVGRGVGPGKPVMLLAANSIEWVVTFWAVLRAGGHVVSANSFWKEREVAHALNISQPVLVIADAPRRALLPEGTASLGIEEIEALLEDEAPFAALGRPVANESAPAVVLFTSGTSGPSKGAVLSHRSQIANIHNLLAAGARLPQEISADTPITQTLISTPLFHIAGIQLITMIALTGGKIVISEGRYDPLQILRLIEQERINRWGAVPTMLTRLMAVPEFGDFDLSSLKFVSTGGMRVPPEVVAQARAAFSGLEGNMGVVYGLSEAGGTLATIGGPDYQNRPTAAGKPFPTVELRIDAPDSDGAGEILARSPTNMNGYLGDAAVSPIDADGWLHTGDLGRIDAEGYLHVSGRSKEVIIRGGENIAAGNVESCIMELPEVLETAVIGLDHPVWGEEVGAAVVLRDGCTIGETELRAHCAAHLAAYSVPSKWRIGREPLPTNDSGKVIKPQIKASWPTDNIPV